MPYEFVILDFIVRPCVKRHADNLKAELDAARPSKKFLAGRKLLLKDVWHRRSTWW